MWEIIEGRREKAYALWDSGDNDEICQKAYVSIMIVEKLIRKLYQDMLREQSSTEKIGKETEEEIRNLLSSEEKGMGQEECARCRDTAFYIAGVAEENGFVQGFRYAFRLFKECMQEG